LYALCAALAVGLSGVSSVQAQSYSSGSTGADGAFNLTTTGTVLFNPPNMIPPIHPTISNVFNFTTINIASGVTLQVSGGIFQAPVYWLATGAVEIDGIVDLSGAPGHAGGISLAQRVPSLPGAGGYPGGVGGWAGNNQAMPESGGGPGGGAPGSGANTNGTSATYTGGQDPIPILGGSGGGGGNCAGTGTFAGGGGAGGGALIIASNVSITVKGSILAPGGNGGYVPCQYGGSGGGGVIRLVAPVVTTAGSLSVKGGTSQDTAASGIARLEYFQGSIGGSISGTYVTSIPFPALAPTTVPSAIQVTSIAGTPVNANPFTFPNSTITTTAPVAVVIGAQYVPTGTVSTLYVFSDSGSDQVIPVPALAGTLASSTATVNVSFPPGASYGYVKAVWNNGPITNVATTTH
jgi:hypothetical protein